MNHSCSIRRAAQTHEIPYSLPQRAIQAGGKTKTRSQALEEWCVCTCIAGDIQRGMAYDGVRRYGMCCVSPPTTPQTLALD